MIVRLHMTRNPLVLEPGMRARHAFGLLQEHRIRHVPVVEKGKLVGIVTDRDLLRSLPGSVAELELASAVDPLVAHVMTRDPVTVGPNEHVLEAARILLERHIHGLPVVSDGKLLGILTATDLFEAFARTLARPEGRRLTLLHAPGRTLDPRFDLAREAFRCRLLIESLVRQDFPGGGIVTELFVDGTPADVERFLDRVGPAGFAVLDSPARQARRGS